jgi:hypothetical protein
VSPFSTKILAQTYQRCLQIGQPLQRYEPFELPLGLSAVVRLDQSQILGSEQSQVRGQWIRLSPDSAHLTKEDVDRDRTNSFETHELSLKITGIGRFLVEFVKVGLAFSYKYS